MGLLLAAPSLARCLFNLPAGALVDSLGRVPCMVMGEIFAALGCLGTGQDLRIACIFLLFVGRVGLIVYWHGFSSLMFSWFDKRRFMMVYDHVDFSGVAFEGVF